VKHGNALAYIVSKTMPDCSHPYKRYVGKC
jgi:hypothetical protein